MSAIVWAVLIAAIALLCLTIGYRRWKEDYAHAAGSLLVVGALLLSVACLSPIWAGGGDKQEKTTQVTKAETPQGLDEDKLAKAFAKEFKSLGFKPGEVEVGDDVDWGKNPVDNRGGAFGQRIESREELTKFLNSDTVEGKAVRQHILGAVPKTERKRALDGASYVPVQYLTEINYDGNPYVAQDGSVRRGGEETAQAGDIVWAYVARNYDIVWDGSVRADCGNPGYHRPPRPHRHHHQPTCEERGTCGHHNCPPRQVKNRNGVCVLPKDPSKDVSQNDKVDDWKKDGDDRHTINHNDGASDSKGYQSDPKKDADKAKDQAEKETQQKEEDHKEESKDDTKVDDNQENSKDDKPDW